MTHVADSPEAVEAFKDLMRAPEARQAFLELKRSKAKEGVQMRYEHVLKAVFATPWAMLEDYMPIVADILVSRMQGFRLDVEDLERIEAARRPSRPEAPQGVAVIPIHGVIVPKASLFSDVSGATSVQSLRSMFREAMASPDVGAIVFDVDSPGGSAEQIPEMAAEIRAARGRKPMVSVANGMAASGAYWLAAMADEFVVTKSGLIGSIGVITAHDDISKALEMAGIKVTQITAGRFKAEMSETLPLSDEARAHAQSMVNEFYAMFVGDVAKGRGTKVETVRGETFGEGRIFTAAEGVRRNLADRIATLDDVIGEQFRAIASRPPAAAQAMTPPLTEEMAEHFALLEKMHAEASAYLVPRVVEKWEAGIADAKVPNPEPDPDPDPDLPTDDTETSADADDELLKVKAELEALAE